MTLSKQILLTFLILFVIVLSSGMVLAECANDSSQPGAEQFCCEELCDTNPVDCELVVACDGLSADFYSRAYANLNGYEIKDDCLECSAFWGSGTTCNNNALGYYSCFIACEHPDGYTTELENCMFDEIEVIAGNYYCYVNDVPSQQPNDPITTCDIANPPSGEYTISGSLEVENNDYTMYVDDFELEFTGGSYPDYNINEDGSFMITDVASGDYVITFTNAAIIEDVCIGCSSPSQSISVTDEDFEITQTIVATCGPTDPEQCSGTSTPPPVCIEDECNPAWNSICEDGVFVYYNLSLPVDYSYYCGEDQCENFDPECTDLTCQGSVNCDGICPPNCYSPEQDPDCGMGGCEFSSSVHKWCNTTLEDWQYYPITIPQEFYCDVCPQDGWICQGSTCGNGIVELESGEQCDYGVLQPGGHYEWTQTTEIYPVSPVASTCHFDYCLPPESPNGGCACNLIQNDCGNEWIEPPEGCESPAFQCEVQGYECDLYDCSCNLLNNDCDFTADSTIESIMVSVVPCDDDLTIRVSLNPLCAQYVNKIKLYDCTSGVCVGQGEEFLTITGGQNPYANFTFNVGSNYNHLYNFSAQVHFDEPNQVGWSDIASEKAVTFLTGDHECLTWNDPLNSDSCQIWRCASSSTLKKNCNSTNHLINESCGDNSICSMATGVAECSENILVDDCDSCMGMAGMFYSSDLVGCDDYFNPSGNNVASCYFDVGYSNVNRAYSCLYVDSCYDYHSEFACGEDSCEKGYGNNACEWAPYNIQTGQGVCRPALSALEDCSQAINFNSNNVFLFSQLLSESNFSASSDRVCELYGDCFYTHGSNAISPARCKNSNEVICNDFVTPEQCLGENLLNFELDETNYLDVINYSSNIISSQAKCKWVDEECIRDADDNGNDDNDNDDPLLIFMEDNHDVDVADLIAQRDFVSPDTTLQDIPENNLFGMNLEIPFNIEDDYSPLNITTYSCLEYNGVDEPVQYQLEQYEPNNVFNSLRSCNFDSGNWDEVEEFSLAENPSSDGYYTIYFFSVDNALNIERLKAIDFQVNTILPKFQMNYSYITYPSTPNYISTLTIEFEVTSSYSSPFTDCTGYLYLTGPDNPIPIMDPPPVMNVTGIGDSFSATYTGREDNTYFYSITCTDTILGNTNSEVYEVLVDGDTRIYDVQPHYETFKADYLDYSLKTHNDATCYYRLRESIDALALFSEIQDCGIQKSLQAGEGMLECGIFNKTLEGGEYIHEKNNIPFPVAESAVYVYDVACNISIYNQTTGEYNNVLVRGNNNDRIIFAQDYNAPIITLQVTENNVTGDYEDLDPYHWYANPYINATCVDDLTFRTGNFFVFGHDLSFGCSIGENPNLDNLFYCSLNGFNCSPEGYAKPNPFIEQYIDPDLGTPGQNSGGHVQHICTYGMDNYSPDPNQGETLCRNILYDGVDPSIIDGGFTIVRQHGSNEPVDVISKAFYNILIDVDEPLGDYALSFTISDGSIQGSISLEPVYDSGLNRLIATLNMFAYPDLDGIGIDDNVTMDFTVELTDVHGRESTFSDEDYLSYSIDTSLPAAPILEPLFGSFHRDVGIFYDIIGNAYPVMFHEENTVKEHTAYAGELFNLDDGFYSNQEDLFITGFISDDEPVNISLLSCGQTEDLQFYTITIDEYDPSLYNGVDENNPWEYSYSSHGLILALKGNNSIHLDDQVIGDQFDEIVGKYVKLPIDSNAYSSGKAQGKVTTYGNYFKYYLVTGISRDSSVSGDIHDIITISPALEENLLPDTGLEFYDSDGLDNQPDDYFELNLETPYEFACDLGTGSNLYTLRARSRYVNGLLNDTSNINYLIDTAAPEIRHVFSAPAGTTIDSTPTIAFNITEHACGSGLFLGNAQLVLTNIVTNDSIAYDLDEPTIGPAEKANLVQYGFTIDIPDYLAQAEYEVSLLIEDYAGNKVVLEDGEWVIDIIDSSGVAKPTIIVSESDSDYNSWNKIYFVNETPTITLSSGDFEDVLVKLQPGNIPMVCVDDPILEEDEFICRLDEGVLTEQIYDIDITALNEEEEAIGHWDDIKLVYDVTAPNVIDLEIPLSIRSGDKRVFKIYLDEPERDILTKISYLDDSYVLEDTSSNPTKEIYASYLDSTYFGWEESSEPYNFSITIFDRAMNSMVINKSIFVDDTPPEINITHFKSGGISFPTGQNPENLFSNITTRNTTLFINGTVDDSLIRDICLNMTFNGITIDLISPCQELCEGEEVPPGCIQNGTGNFQFSFALTLDSNQVNEEELWNIITIIATDEAFNQEVKSLAALMDWLSPSVVDADVI